MCVSVFVFLGVCLCFCLYLNNIPTHTTHHPHNIPLHTTHYHQTTTPTHSTLPPDNNTRTQHTIKHTEPDLKKRMKIRLINAAGLEEAGVDGGGLFREFMTELMKAGFDPNRGFFKTTSDKLHYPNPQSKILYPNDFLQHFYFLGRILGRVVWCYGCLSTKILPIKHSICFHIQ